MFLSRVIQSEIIQLVSVKFRFCLGRCTYCFFPPFRLPKTYKINGIVRYFGISILRFNEFRFYSVRLSPIPGNIARVRVFIRIFGKMIVVNVNPKYFDGEIA